MKIYQHNAGHTTTMAATSIYRKKLFKNLLQNHWTYFDETCGLLLIILCSNDDPGFTFTDFKYGKDKVCNLGFSVGKNEDFSKTIAACDLKIIELM